MLTWIPESSVKLYWGDFFAFEPDWSWSTTKLANLDLWYVTDGKGWIKDEEKQISIRVGDCLLLRPGQAYQAGHDPAHPIKLIAVHFDLNGAAGRQSEVFLQKHPFVRQIQAYYFLRSLLTHAVDCYKDGCYEWACGWLQAALMEIIRQDTQISPAWLQGEQKRIMEQICQQIRSHPARPVRIEHLADELDITPEHFCRLFRRFQGMSPRAYITKSRIEAAKSWLLRSSYSITRIAGLVGYEDPFYFSRQFKAKAGMSPSDFRKG